jgi:hypothetical protein
VSAALFAIALFLVAGGILAFLAMQSQQNKGSGINVEPGNSEPLAVFSVAQAFDPDYAIIWDTQFPALQLIDNAGVKGIRTQQLYLFYLRSARRYPELYDGSNFGSWLEFLEREQLVRKKATRVFITAEGHEFLAYRVAPETVLAG